MAGLKILDNFAKKYLKQYCLIILHNENNFPTESGENFLSGIWYRKSSLGTIELQVRRKIKVELFNDDGIYVLQKELKYYYTFKAKNILVLKWNYIHLALSDDTG